MRRLLVCGALVIGATACARVDELRGEREPLTTREFAEAAAARCTAASTAMRELGLDRLEAPAPGGDEPRLRLALRARRLGYLEVRELDAPASLASGVRAFTDTAIAAIDELTERSRAAERGDAVAARTAAERASKGLDRARTEAKAVGVDACIP